MIIFDLKEKQLIISQKMLLVPEIKELYDKYILRNKPKDKDYQYFINIMSYMANMYEYDSPYTNILPQDRKKILLSDFNVTEKDLLNPEIIKLENKIKELCVTPEEQLESMFYSKLEEAITLYKGTTITIENLDKVMITIQKVINESLSFKENLKKRIAENKTQSEKGRVKGGRTTNMFEE